MLGGKEDILCENFSPLQMETIVEVLPSFEEYTLPILKILVLEFILVTQLVDNLK